tara:strand:- start:168 stop:341 length:174 start_codon:yes stop_codon:yes gene_type:complete
VIVCCLFLGVWSMKKYLLLIEDEKLWEKFKESIQKDINSEIIELIKKKVKKTGKQNE